MAWPVSGRFHTILGGPHKAQFRCDVYSGGVLQATEVPYKNGSVTDQWVTGQRRNLTLEVPDTYWWKKWLALPGLEIRPYAGVSYGQGGSELCPMGVFEVLVKPRNLIPGSLSLKAPDRWNRAVPMFLYPTWATTELTAARSVAGLIRASEGVQIETTSLARTPSVLWQGDKMKVISDLLKAIGAEASFDRTGVPVIKDRAYKWPVVTVRPGRGGTITDMTATADLSVVRNALSVSSSNTDVVFETVTAAITDPTDPAHPDIIGLRSEALTSSVLRDQDEAKVMLYTELRKRAAFSRQLSVTQVPDYSIDAGDVIVVNWDQAGEFEFVGVQSVSHPLREGLQSITTVDVREESLV
jgi:hypothetical protein